MSSNFKYRGYGFALLAILPLLINEMIGFPKLTPILLFPASVCVIYFILKCLERTRFPLTKDANSGIKLMFLGLATLTFLPLLLNQNNPTGKIQAVLFISYVPLFYVLLRFLEKVSRRFSVIVAIGAVLFSAVNAIYHGLTGTEIDYLVFASILDTHTKEAIEYLSSAFSVRFTLLMVASLVVILAFFRLTRNILVGRRFFPAKVTNAVLLAIPLSGMLHLSQSRYKVTEFYPVKEVYQFVRYFNEVHVIVKEYRNLEHEFKGDLNRETGVTVILVLGESARMESLGIYGSEHDTTPHLDRFAQKNPGNLLLFTDAVAAASYSRVSVPTMLSVCTLREYNEMPRRPSILKIMKSAGRDAVLISNQAMRGFHDSFISAFMEDAARRTYLKDSGHHYDEELIPLLITELEGPGETSKLILLHLSGSHYEYNANYPEDQAFFTPDSLENEYLNSIRYTDFVLQRILDIMMEADQPLVMLYASDHGEYLNDYGDGFYGHGYRNHLTRFEIDVPFFLVVNERFLRDHPTEFAEMYKRTELGVSHDNVSHTLLGLMGIYDATYQPEFDLSSKSFVENPRFIIERSNNITLLDEVRVDNTKFEGTRKDRD